MVKRPSSGSVRQSKASASPKVTSSTSNNCPSEAAMLAAGTPASDTPSLTTSWRATRRTLLPGAGRRT